MGSAMAISCYPYKNYISTYINYLFILGLVIGCHNARQVTCCFHGQVLRHHGRLLAELGREETPAVQQMRRHHLREGVALNIDSLDLNRLTFQVLWWFTMVYPIFFLGLCHFGGYLEGLGSFKMV